MKVLFQPNFLFFSNSTGVKACHPSSPMCTVQAWPYSWALAVVNNFFVELLWEGFYLLSFCGQKLLLLEWLKGGEPLLFLRIFTIQKDNTESVICIEHPMRWFVLRRVHCKHKPALMVVCKNLQGFFFHSVRMWGLDFFFSLALLLRLLSPRCVNITGLWQCIRHCEL